MKIKDGFILREVAGSYIVVAVGERVKTFNGIINLNDTGAFLWKLIEKGSDEVAMKEELLKEYEVDEETAARDVRAFVAKLEETGLI